MSDTLEVTSVRLSTKQQALIWVSIYAALLFTAFALFKTLLYVFVFSLVSILVVNFILKNLMKLRFPYWLAVTLALLLYFFAISYAFINIVPVVLKQVGSFYEFMQRILDAKYWEEYLVDQPELSETIGGVVEWLKPRLAELFEAFTKWLARELPRGLIVIFYSILFTVYVSIYTNWTIHSLPRLFPKKVRPPVEEFLRTLGIALSSYVDVLLLGAFIVAISFYVLFSFYLPSYTVLLSFWGFVTNLIPIVGVVIEWIPILIVSLGLGLRGFIIVNAVVSAIHLGAFLFFIFIMKRRADINPVLMLIFIFIVGLVYGPVGTFFAVPVAIFFVTLWNEFIKEQLEGLK